MVSQTNFNTFAACPYLCRILYTIRQNKFVAKLVEFRILVKDKITFLGLDHRVALLILYFVRIFRNQFAKFEIDRTSRTCLN